MPVINSRSNAKFDALIRTNKDDSLMAFIKASHNVRQSENRKQLIAENLINSYNLFRENGSGTYGNGQRDLMDQFESHYTMGYEMGIWIDSELNLSDLAIQVADYTITVKQYIGIVFKNLFTYYEQEGESKYHHFLYEVLMKIKESGTTSVDYPKSLIVSSLPITERQLEQGNLLFNYLMSSDLFVKISNDNFKFSQKWENKIDELLSECNLEYKDRPKNEAIEMARNKTLYSQYVSQVKNNSNFLILNENPSEEIQRMKGGENVLFYGVPGSGKSHTIETEYGNQNIVRIVFHPDYMNTDFIGQILPTVKDDKTITYEFTPGPFTKIMKKAYKDPSNMYYLVIEEINRGNAPAIFGEIFQLLDRSEDGTSKYAVVNYAVAREMYGNPSNPIKIPSNLTILATMNTSDQNVFTLDTAFQRRWNMKMIKNDIENAIHKDVEILDTKISWGAFNNTINYFILNSNTTSLSSEDKRLGAYFIAPHDLNRANLFEEKVIKYLWDDAFKFSRDKIFDSELKSLEDVVDKFQEERGTAKFSIFNQSVNDKLIEEQKNRQVNTDVVLQVKNDIESASGVENND